MTDTPSDIPALAQQLRCPSGTFGEQVGAKMAEFNAGVNSWMIDVLDVQRDDLVLEIGFGPGETLAELVRLTPDGFVAGVDHSQTMLDAAHTRNSRAIIQDKLELSLGNATALPYADASFTKVCAANVIYFWEHLLGPLQEMHRVLRPGGCAVLFFMDPAHWLPGVQETGIFHVHMPEAVVKSAEQAGFTARIEEKTISGGKGYCLVAQKS